jgi:uncharacterized protein (TIGR02246 family)
MMKCWHLSLITSLLATAIMPLDIGIANAVPEKPNTAKVVYTAKKNLPSAVDLETLGLSWGKAIASRDPKQITALYDAEAVLLATFTNKLDTEAKIFNYFVGLTKHEGLTVKFDEQSIRVLDEDTASNSGLYTFSFIENGKTVNVPARYTFLYEKRGDKWMIIEHHSSLRPEKPVK